MMPMDDDDILEIDFTKKIKKLNPKNWIIILIKYNKFIIINIINFKCLWIYFY